MTSQRSYSQSVRTLLYLSSLAAVLAFVGAAWLRDHDEQTRARALAEARVDAYSIVLARRDSLDALRADSLARLRDDVARLETERAELRSSLALTRAHARARVDSIDALLALLPADVAASIDSTVSGLVAEADACSAALANCDSLHVADSLTVVLLTASRDALRVDRDSLRTLWLDAEQRADVSLLDALWRAAPVTALVAATTFVLGALFAR